jgi:predicted DCC family thiol-disulfide oxidoreductase YuxK
MLQPGNSDFDPCATDLARCAFPERRNEQGLSVVPIPQHAVVSEGVFAAVGLAALVLAWWFRTPVFNAIRRFFSEPGSAFDLAVFRLIFYATALALVDTPEDQVEHYAALPRGLMFPPTGSGWLAKHIPLSATLVQTSYWILVGASVLAAVGLFTRIASVVFLLAATYYLTIPQLFGKVNHYHIVVWVAAVLAVSRTADVFSLDSVIQAKRHPHPAAALVPTPSRAYARPIRLTWLFLGIGYLGPGLWKYRTAGIEWASASNMRAILYDKWYELGNYRPFIPVDKSGLLLTLGALMTLGFEITFIALLWNRYTRLLAAAMGLFFHTMTNLTMRIPFYWSMILYTSFVEWDRISRWWLARRETLVFAFDGGCGVCRTTAIALARNSLPGGAEFTSAQEASATGKLPADADLSTVLTDIHVFTPTRTFKGFDAYRRLAWRVPLLWPILPLLYLPPVGLIGRRVYRRVADHRLCHVASEPQVPVRPLLLRRRWTVAPTTVGAIILSLALVAAATDTVNGWPVALYPTFAGLHTAQSNRLSVVRLSTTGAATTIALKSCFRWMPSDRYAGLVRSTIARTRDGQHDLIGKLITAASKECPQLATNSASFAFYNETVETTPGRVGRLVGRELLLRSTAT